MRLWRNPTSKEGELNHQDSSRKILYIKVGLILVLSIILGYSAHIALFMPSYQEMHPININLFDEGEWKQSYPFEPYIDGAIYLKTNILKDTIKGKFLRLRTVTASNIYSGVTCYINQPVPENARLSLTWRSKGHTPELIIDVMDGSKLEGPGNADSLANTGELYTLACPVPGNEWSTFTFPLDTLTLNPSQPAGKIIDGVFDYNKVRSVNISVCPGSDLTLDIKDIHFYWNQEKWMLASDLFIIGLLGLLLVIRTKPEKLFFERGTTLNINAITSRIIYCLIALSAFTSIFLRGSLFSDPVNITVYSALLILIIVDEFVVFPKPHPLWSLRYAVVLFTGYYMGFSGGVLSVCLILLASYIPLALLERFRVLFWVIIMSSVLGYTIQPYPDTHFHFLTGLIMIISTSVTAIIFRGYMQQQHKDFLLGQALLQYEALFKRTSDAIYVLDENGKITALNQSFERLTGFSSNELKGKNILSFVCPESAEAVKSMLNAGDGNELKQYDIHFAHKNGNPRTALVRCSVIYKDKQITGYQALATDITERKATEEKLAATVGLLEKKAAELAELNKLLKVSEEQLKELNASKDRFFSIISHDLRNPFHSLLSLSDMIVEDYESLSGEEIKMIFSHINNSVQNVYRLLENLLQWANIQNGKMVYNFSGINLYYLVETVLEILRDNAVNKNIQLCNGIRKDLLIYADFNSVHSIIQNLITNAIKFTNPGGLITISSVMSGKLIEITVEDNGIGMSSQALEKLFRIDVHHSTEGTAKELGTGLGLILCKEMLEHNGGTIHAESEPEKGSRFIFTLPKFEFLGKELPPVNTLS